MSTFHWTKRRSKAAIYLAQGYTIMETANEVGVNERSIRRWKADIEFIQEVDRLSLMVDIASRAERLRIAIKTVRNLQKHVKPTEKDLLDWLKYAQSETDGVKLDLTTLLDNVASVAGSGQDGLGKEGASEKSSTSTETPVSPPSAK